MQTESFTDFLISEAAEKTLIEKAERHDVSVDVLYEIFDRGIVAWREETKKTPEQYAFNRVDSFLAGGLAAKIDADLVESHHVVGKMKGKVFASKPHLTKSSADREHERLKKAGLTDSKVVSLKSLDEEILDEGKKINDKVKYDVVRQRAKSVVKKHTQREKHMYHTKATNLLKNVKQDRVINRTNALGRKLDAKGHVVEGKEFIENRQHLHDTHHEVSRQMAGMERDPELRRVDLHRAKKHKHASQVLEILKTRGKKKK